MPSTKKADRGTSEKFPQVEQQVYDWVSERRLQGIAVSTVEIRLQGRLIAKKLGLQDFKGSADWCYGFMRRKELSIRSQTHISQKLPEDYEDKLVQFQRFIIKHQTYDFEFSRIGNADQPADFWSSICLNRSIERIEDGHHQHNRQREEPIHSDACLYSWRG